jgi:hypothetical protein
MRRFETHAAYPRRRSDRFSAAKTVAPQDALDVRDVLRALKHELVGENVGERGEPKPADDFGAADEITSIPAW